MEIIKIIITSLLSLIGGIIGGLITISIYKLYSKISNRIKNKTDINEEIINVHLEENTSTIIEMSREYDITESNKKEIAKKIYNKIKNDRHNADIEIINAIKPERYIEYIYNILEYSESEDQDSIQKEQINPIDIKKLNQSDGKNKDISQALYGFYSNGEDI